MSNRQQRGQRASANRLTAAAVGLVLTAILAAWQGRSPLGPRPSASPAAAPSLPPAPETAAPARHGDEVAPARITDPALRRQIDAVIDSMDRSGRPPMGIAQGGRRGGDRGLFENAEGRLPGKPRGYYRETDVWPRGPDGRGAERLIFGRNHEVWYSPDHYRSFQQVR